MNLLVAFFGAVASAALGYAVTKLFDYLFKNLKEKRWIYFAVAGVFALLFVFFYSSSPYFRDAIKAYTSATPMERECFFEARITDPRGADSRTGAHAYNTKRDNDISWSPSDCVMVIQAYQENVPIQQLTNKNPNEAGVEDLTTGYSGEIEIKIFKEGFETATHSIWIEVEPQQ